MKSILLVDCELEYVNSIINQTDWQISVLITMHYADTDGFKGDERIKNILYDTDFDNNDDLKYFDYKDIDYFRFAQLKYENYFNRNFVDYQLGKFNYYRGLPLVKKIFAENEIDCVIICNLNHGLVFDCLVVEMAKYFGIPCFNIEPMLAYKNIIFDNLKNKLVEIDNKTIEYKTSLFYKVETDNIKRLCNDDNYVRNVIRKAFYNIGGWLGVEFLSCVSHFDLRPNSYGINFIDRVCHYIMLKILKKKLDKKSTSFNKNNNYIFFALHLEPEATIAGRSKMDSQIMAIKMISEALPQGWILYVKEHPHQFRCNTVTFSLYMYNSIIFKTKRFYNEINKLKNVKIIRTDEDSKQIIKYAKAVATMSGTIALEGAKLNKPVMLFSAERTIYNKCNDFYKINSFEDCQCAIEKIIRGNPVDYSDIDDVFKKYLVDVSEAGKILAIKSIQKSL